MNYNRLVKLFLNIGIVFHLFGCGGSGVSSNNSGSSTSSIPYLAPRNSTNEQSYISASGNNVLPVSISGSNCGSSPYLNQPCVSVTVCVPGSSNCQTINNILLDTGSYGFRVFKSVLSITLPNITNTSGYNYGTCATFGIGADWGSVNRADLILGNDKASSVPVQLIDSSFANYSSHCNGGQVDTSSSSAGFNGILGVGGFIQDCGTTCTTTQNNGVYFACSGSSCSGATVTLANQIANPITFLSSDNNGSILVLPDVASSGGTSSGVFILGIGTESNNSAPSNLSVLVANQSSGYIETSYNGATLNAILDSGTNAYSFYSNSISSCTDITNFYCPSGVLNLTPTQIGTSNNTVSTSIYVANTDSLVKTNNLVFDNIAFANSSTSNIFIYGLPFYLGKAVFMGIEGKSSSIGSGIYWAY